MLVVRALEQEVLVREPLERRQITDVITWHGG